MLCSAYGLWGATATRLTLHMNGNTLLWSSFPSLLDTALQCLPIFPVVMIVFAAIPHLYFTFHAWLSTILDEIVSAELHQLGLQLRKLSLGTDNEHNYIHCTCFGHRQTDERAYPLGQVLHMIVPYGLLSQIVDLDFHQLPTRASCVYLNRKEKKRSAVPTEKPHARTPST